MAVYSVNCNNNSGASPALASTKVKVVANVACYYAVGSSPVAYTSGNCSMIPANVVRDINVGPGALTVQQVQGMGNTVVSGTGPQIAFISVTGMPTVVSVTEIGSIDFTRVSN